MRPPKNAPTPKNGIHFRSHEHYMICFLVVLAREGLGKKQSNLQVFLQLEVVNKNTCKIGQNQADLELLPFLGLNHRGNIKSPQ